jgi:hypothetical protein
MVRHVGKAAQGSNGAVAAVDGEDEGNEVGDYKVPCVACFVSEVT